MEIEVANLMLRVGVHVAQAKLRWRQANQNSSARFGPDTVLDNLVQAELALASQREALGRENSRQTLTVRAYSHGGESAL